jgi:hypothetical protein
MCLGSRQPLISNRIGHEDREVCRSPRRERSVSALCSWRDGHHADREFDLDDLVLIAFAARKSRKRKEAREGAREPSKLGMSCRNSDILGPTPTTVNLCRLQRIKILRRRCRKATNSKAVGAPPRLTALPSSPYRAVFLDSIRRAVEPPR